MKACGVRWIIACSAIFLAIFSSKAATTGSFVNFETAPVHPVAISPSGAVLAVCNLPDGQVELFDLRSNLPQFLASVPVGVDPVTVRFRSENELWVVNYISDSIDVIDVGKRMVVDVLDTGDGPADVVFAKEGQTAFVSCPSLNRVFVLDVSKRTFSPLDILGERPKAMAASPDGKKVYVAIHESGNGTTILAPRITSLIHLPAAGPADLPTGPHDGINPPPNVGTNFIPAITNELRVGRTPPRVSLIVKRQPDGRWMDDNSGDWTEMVSGTNAAFSGRVPGWDLPDHDIAVIDTATLTVDYVDRLMNICFDVAVNPKSGMIALIGTDGINHVRYEPVLQSVFTRAEVALVPAALNPAAVRDLNPHLDYKSRTIPIIQRSKSVGDPRGAVWDGEGKRLFVAGMGSDNLIVLDERGARVGNPVALPSGPAGLAFETAKNRLYVLSRFAASVTVLDGKSLGVLGTLSLHDATPAAIRKGRTHFYNTQKTSGLGQAACASCHIDGRMDRLAWDLGDQTGKMKEITDLTHNFGAIRPAVTNDFHPMKGPMVTQTLQDIIGKEPFHWRGDRNGIEEFNPTFVALQGRDRELSDAEMQEFEDFLATLHFPPNRFRNFDNSLPSNLPLPGHYALGRGKRAKGTPLPNGNAVAGLALFRTNAVCSQCHTLPAGTGTDQAFLNGRWSTILPGPKGEHHMALNAVERSANLPFKIPQLRNLAEKVGFDLLKPSLSGFGFMHDGRADTLTRFLQDGFDFDITDDQRAADMIAFLLAFSGSDLPAVFLPTSSISPPGGASLDAPAAAGRQLLVVSTNGLLQSFMQRAISSTGRVDLIVKGMVQGRPRGWLFDRFRNWFQSDQETERETLTELLALSGPGAPLVFTLVPAGTGRRLGVDRDEDTFLDFDEILGGSDPANANSSPRLGGLAAMAARAEGKVMQIEWKSTPGQRYRVFYKPSLGASEWTLLEDGIIATGSTTAHTMRTRADSEQGFYKIEVQSEP